MSANVLALTGRGRKNYYILPAFDRLMRKAPSIMWMVALAGTAIGVSACATAPPPPPPAPVLISSPPPPPPPVQTAHSPDEDWNIFPDPTTGTIDIYHKGQYVGVITGNEPPEQDPPLPHPPDDPYLSQ